MRFVRLFMLFSIVLFISNTVSAEWAYKFVVNDGKVYVITDDQVNPEHIGSKLGSVTKHSTQIGTYSGNFSNYYPEGTEYFEILNTDPNEAIAIKDEAGQYMRAEYGGEYAGRKFHWNHYIPYIFAVLLTVFVCYLLMKRINR